ncbi:hypothetical protein ACFCYB_33215 [Streptomyces sp. NPDC056309]
MCTANGDGAILPSRRTYCGTLLMTRRHYCAQGGAYAGTRSVAAVGTGE